MNHFQNVRLRAEEDLARSKWEWLPWGILELDWLSSTRWGCERLCWMFWRRMAKSPESSALTRSWVSFLLEGGENQTGTVQTGYWEGDFGPLLFLWFWKGKWRWRWDSLLNLSGFYMKILSICQFSTTLSYLSSAQWRTTVYILDIKSLVFCFFF